MSRFKFPDEAGVDKEAEKIMSAAAEKDSWQDFSMVRNPYLREGLSSFNFQDFAVMQSLNSSVYVLGLATGLGKTLCSWLTYLWYRSQVPVKLLVVTKSTSLLQYRKEYDIFFENTPYKFETIYKGMTKKNYASARKDTYKKWVEDLDGILMGWPIFQRDGDFIISACNEIRRNGEIPFVVFDEVTAISNMKTKTHKVAVNCARMALTPLQVSEDSFIQGKVLGATATLIRGRLENIYGMFKGMGCQITDTKNSFMELFTNYREDPENYRKYIYGYKNPEMFIEAIRPYVCIIKKRDVSSELPTFLPPRKIWLEHSQEQINLINEIYKGNWDRDKLDLTDPQGQEKFDKMLPLLISGNVKRALQDVRLVTKEGLDEDLDFKLSPKTGALIDILADEYTDEKVIVYCPSVQYLRLLKKTIENHSRKLATGYREPLEISGDNANIEVREENRILFQDLNSGRNLIFVTKAGVEAVNLQVAQSLIVMTMPVSGGDMLQLAGRLSRLGSKYSSLLITYLLMENSQDEDEYLILNQQMQLIAMIQGDVDEGLIDFQSLQEFKGILDENSRASMQDLIATLFKRRKRASYYDKRSK